MSRYNSNNGGSTGGNNGDYDDDTTIKLQKYAAVSLEPKGLNTSSHAEYGTSFITNYEKSEILDGIVFQRDDKPGTWKVFSAGKFFHLNPEDGLVYENFDEEEGYSGEMSAQDILDHPRVAGFSENFGGTDYFYNPVGAIVEEADDIATNDELEIETTDAPSIEVGDASMLLNNKTWVRTFAKLLTEEGNNVINDNGEYGEDADNPKNDPHDWLATDEPTLRDELEGRSLELWVTEEERELKNGDTITYTVPNLKDVQTDSFVTIDNGADGDDAENSSEQKQAAATDGGTATQSTGQAQSSPSTSESESSSDSSDDSSSGRLPENVPDKLDDLIDYMARNGETSADEIKEFAEDEVEDVDAIDWEAAAEEANSRSGN